VEHHHGPVNHGSGLASWHLFLYFGIADPVVWLSLAVSVAFLGFAILISVDRALTYRAVGFWQSVILERIPWPGQRNLLLRRPFQAEGQPARARLQAVRVAAGDRSLPPVLARIWHTSADRPLIRRVLRTRLLPAQQVAALSIAMRLESSQRRWVAALLRSVAQHLHRASIQSLHNLHVVSI
jgi:hypothetical protein